ATYEPLILKWYSGVGICSIASSLKKRLTKIDAAEKKNFSTAQYLTFSRNLKSLPDLTNVNIESNHDYRPTAVSNTNFKVNAKEVKKIEVDGFPEAISVDGKVFLNGYLDIDDRTKEN